MNKDKLKRLEQQFLAYTSPFIQRADDPEPYIVKQDHTFRVAENMGMLAGSLDLDDRQGCIARAAALLHDLGRFPQFEAWGTFIDRRSVNHAALGLRVIIREGFLGGIPQTERRLILRTVALHNRPRLPRCLPDRLDCLARMLRDADKLDIYRVMLELYQRPVNGQTSFITHDRVDDGKISDDIANDILAGREVRLSRVTTLNDMKLFQLGMLADLNFPAAFRKVQHMGVVRIILGSMPKSPLLRSLESFMDDRVATLARQQQV
ncbi:MAG TPA: diguanylate cyclase [Desulfobacteraceae bacterium]|nr:diguanylate cyclase [Desulfobacteraceae bacterium]|tara:strand:- start:37 stop:828 length:792 start_codon:yes stop_codon:yes gene_type:complete